MSASTSSSVFSLDDGEEREADLLAVGLLLVLWRRCVLKEGSMGVTFAFAFRWGR